MQQKRNDAVVDAQLFGNIVTQNKEVKICLPLPCLFTQLALAPFVRRYGSDRCDTRTEIHPIQ